MDTEIPSAEYLHLHHLKEFGYDFAPLMEMLTYLPDRPKKAWRKIAADHEKLGRFFKAVRCCKAANGIKEYFREKVGPVGKGRPKGESLEPRKVREECRGIARQADALHAALVGIFTKLQYRFGNGIPEVDKLRDWIFTLDDISVTLMDLGYDGNPKWLDDIEHKIERELKRQGKPKRKKVIPMDGMPALNAYHDLARELLDLTGGVKIHAMAIWAMVALHFEDARTANDLKNKSQDSIAEWLAQKSARESRTLLKRYL